MYEHIKDYKKIINRLDILELDYKKITKILELNKIDKELVNDLIFKYKKKSDTSG
jgi:hypothetical protein